jgi:penicillin-binding protein 1A
MEDAPRTRTQVLLALLRRPKRWQWLAIIAAVLLAAFLWLAWALPLDRALEPLPDPTLVLLDRHGEPFAKRGAVKLEPVDSRLLPRDVVQAFLSIEDRRFFRHDGIDPRGLLRAALHNARAGAVEEGGSTITQQLAKTSFLTPARSLRRKVQEALIALWLEARLDKHEILSRYLSSIYFGDGVYGLRAASQHYFGVEPERLELTQAAMLAGLVKAPSALAPSRHPRAAGERMQVVLDAMVENGALDARRRRGLPSPRIREDADDLPVGSYFADWLSPEAKDAFASAYGEVEVRTTLDSGLQALAQDTISRRLGEAAASRASQAALVAMRPNGEVVAMVGGRDYAASPFNRVTQAQRQPGSAFKLFVYYAAIDKGMRPDDRVEDAPIEVAGWSPANYDGNYDGAVSVRDAFAHSSNVAAVRVAQDVGIGAVAKTARDFGIRSKLGEDASLALGSYETNLMELTAAYAALAAGAAPVLPFGALEHPPAQRQRPLEGEARAAMLDLLWTAVERGTGKNARLGIPAFGKTGTTQDHRDALFVGMAGDLVVGVWMGNDDNAPMQGVTGGSLPAQIWHDFMVSALREGDYGAGLAAWQPPASRARENAAAPRMQRARSRFANWFHLPRHRAHGHGKGGKGKGRGHKRK